MTKVVGQLRMSTEGDVRRPKDLLRKLPASWHWQANVEYRSGRDRICSDTVSCALDRLTIFSKSQV